MEHTKHEIKKEVKQQIEQVLVELYNNYDGLQLQLSYYIVSVIRKKEEIAQTDLKLFKDYIQRFTKSITDLVNLFYSNEYLENIDKEYKDEVVEELVNLNAVSLKIYQLYKRLLEIKHDFSNIEIIDLRFILDELIDLRVDINEILYIPLRELEDF